jgi:hypothetical protein
VRDSAEIERYCEVLSAFLDRFDSGQNDFAEGDDADPI